MVYADDDESIVDAEVNFYESIGFGASELVIAHNSPVFNLFLQEDGSLPDRDQVGTMLTLLHSWVFYRLHISSVVTSC